LGVREAVLCGLSMGGYVIFELLRRHPGRVKAMILADTKPQADSVEAKRGREELTRVAEQEGQDAVIEQLLPRLLAPATQATQPEVVGQVREMARRWSVPGLVGALRTLRDRPDSTETLRLAGAAIDAFVRVDIQLILTLVDAVHGADIHARPILHIDAGLCDDVRHSGSKHVASAPAPPDSRRIANIVRGPTPVQGLVAGTAIRVMSDRMPTRNAYWSSAVSSGSSAARPKPSVAAAATPSSTSSPSEVANHITAMTATAIQRCRRVRARKPRAPSSCHTGTRLKRLTQAPKCAMAPHTATLVMR